MTEEIGGRQLISRVSVETKKCEGQVYEFSLSIDFDPEVLIEIREKRRQGVIRTDVLAIRVTDSCIVANDGEVIRIDKYNTKPLYFADTSVDDGALITYRVDDSTIEKIEAGSLLSAVLKPTKLVFDEFRVYATLNPDTTWRMLDEYEFSSLREERRINLKDD